MASLDSVLTTTLSPWAERLRATLNLPVLLRWCLDSGHSRDVAAAPALKLGDFAEPRVEIRIKDRGAVPLLLSPTLDNLGQAYVEGRIDLIGSAQDLMAVAWRLAEAGASDLGKRARTGPFARVLRQFGRAGNGAALAGQRHSKASDREAIHYHYDVSNEFYSAWLDPAMVYSCAYFENGDETLAEAQTKKIDHILNKLRIEPGQRLLDIGCGWGALVLRAAQTRGARCVGITLSQNQFDLARERVRAAGLQDRVEIRLEDYREVRGGFDRIASVGMCEHVGLANLQSYFARIHELLEPHGWALNHGITTTDPNNRGTSHDAGSFIDRYVFPQGELPHIGTVLTTMQAGGLEPIDSENLRRHYARTTRLWSDAFEAAGDRLRDMVGEKTWRIWRIYLAGCPMAFERDEIALFQVLCRPAGRKASEAPWSRRFIYQEPASFG